MELRNFKAASVNTDAKENPSNGKKVFGLLGYELFKDYEITIDYQNNMITLIKVDESGNYVSQYSMPRKVKAGLRL